MSQIGIPGCEDTQPGFTASEIAELERLAEEARDRPWSVEYAWAEAMHTMIGWAVGYGDISRRDVYVVTSSEESFSTADADAEYIVAACNGLGRWLRERRRMQAEIERLRWRLWKLEVGA